MKNAKKTLITLTSAFLLMSIVFPTVLTNNAKASGTEHSVEVDENYRNDTWFKIQTDQITLLFPAGGKKPMFLWWYSNDTSHIFVVKFKGLVEYTTLALPYYTHRSMANAEDMKERMADIYESMMPVGGMHPGNVRNFIQNYDVWRIFDFHPALLSFSSAKWNLTGPVNVTREDGARYISFNFTLVTAPPNFDFAEGNVIIRARFYLTDATESAEGAYDYTVHAGELKIDLIIKNWNWNVDRLGTLFNALHDDYNVTVPKMRAGLALWTDLASINIVNMTAADNDARTDSDVIEGASTASDVIVGEQRVQVQDNNVATGADETPIKERIRDQLRLRFAQGSQTLAGFFDFVDKALVINETSGDITQVNVTASYISAGAHLRLFIGYPYFGSNTLEHDPTIGVDAVVPWLSTNLLIVLITATAILASAVAVFKMRKKIVNIVDIQ